MPDQIPGLPQLELERLARNIFGLPVDRLRHYHQLTGDQQHQVSWIWNAVSPDRYIYAVKSDGLLVMRRERIPDPFPGNLQE